MNKLLIFIYLLLVPFYFFSSGLPQVSELILSFLFLINIIDIFKMLFRKISIPFTVLFVWMILVNIAYYFITQRMEFLTYNLFYVFNWVAILLVIVFLFKDKLLYLKTFLWGSYLSALLQVILSLIYSTDSIRESLFFNNPNQLAYYSILIVIIVLYCNLKLKGSLFINYSIIIMGLYLILLSASMTGLLSIFIIIVGYSILNSKSRFEKVLSWSLGIITVTLTKVIAVNTTFLYGNNRLLDNVLYRMNMRNTSTSNVIDERGYNRILDNPEYLLFGAGEGYFERFNTNIELHSSLGTQFFSYGLIGLLLFLLIIILIFSKIHFKFSYLLIGPFIYGLTHYGLRETLFWVFISILIFEVFENNQQLKNKVKL